MHESSDAVRDALGSMGTHCTQVLSVDAGVCGLELDIGLGRKPNFVCDQVLVGTCSAGHERMVSVID